MIIKISKKTQKTPHSFFSHFLIANILRWNNSSCEHLQIVSWEMNKVRLLTLVSREHGSDVCVIQMQISRSADWYYVAKQNGRRRHVMDSDRYHVSAIKKKKKQNKLKHLLSFRKLLNILNADHFLYLQNIRTTVTKKSTTFSLWLRRKNIFVSHRLQQSTLQKQGHQNTRFSRFFFFVVLLLTRRKNREKRPIKPAAGHKIVALIYLPASREH